MILSLSINLNSLFDHRITECEQKRCMVDWSSEAMLGVNEDDAEVVPSPATLVS